MKKQILFIVLIVFLMNMVSSFEVRYFPTNYERVLEGFNDYCSSNECIKDYQKTSYKDSTNIWLRSSYNSDVSLRFSFSKIENTNKSYINFKLTLPYIIENENCTSDYPNRYSIYCRPTYLINESEYNFEASLRKDLYEFKKMGTINTEDQLIEDIIEFATQEEYASGKINTGKYIYYRLNIDDYETFIEHCRVYYESEKWAIIDDCGANTAGTPEFPFEISGDLINQYFDSKQNQIQEREFDYGNKTQEEGSMQERLSKQINNSLEIAKQEFGSGKYGIILSPAENYPIILLGIEKQGRLFGIFKINYEIAVKMNIETHEIYSVKKPWWSFLASSN